MAEQQAAFAEKQRLVQQRQAVAALEASEGAHADNERAIRGLQKKVCTRRAGTLRRLGPAGYVGALVVPRNGNHCIR